jgi:hypothetical protein
MSSGVDRLAAAERRETPALADNARALEGELAWLERVLTARLQRHFEPAADPLDIAQLGPPDLAGDASAYAGLVRECGLGLEERLVLLLALAPQLRPHLLDLLFVRNPNFDRGFSEFGGRKGPVHGGFLPTLETAAFLVAGDDLAARFRLRRLFEHDHALSSNAILAIDHPGAGEPQLSAALGVSAETLDLVTVGDRHKPDFSGNFPAKLITTRLAWSDLVLDADVLDEVLAIEAWIRHGTRILEEWALGKSLKPGYRSLFFGPPGTGKTLTATLIGQAVGADVYRIDLSMVVSKFIGETEKNLAKVFDQAQNRRWILFFDEADALFGKRTATSSSNDRHANQEVSYLLQRVEDFPGIVILATNLKANIDEAFARRFQSMVHFPMPDADQRLRLWRGILGGTGRLAPDVDLEQLAQAHELAGGAIANVVRFSALSALQAGRDTIVADDLRRGVAKELRKEGRTL